MDSNKKPEVRDGGLRIPGGKGGSHMAGSSGHSSLPTNHLISSSDDALLVPNSLLDLPFAQTITL